MIVFMKYNPGNNPACLYSKGPALFIPCLDLHYPGPYNVRINSGNGKTAFFIFYGFLGCFNYGRINKDPGLIIFYMDCKYPLHKPHLGPRKSQSLPRMKQIEKLPGNFNMFRADLLYRGSFLPQQLVSQGHNLHINKYIKNIKAEQPGFKRKLFVRKLVNFPDSV